MHDVEHNAPVKLTRRGEIVAVLLSRNEYARLTACPVYFWDAFQAFASEFQASIATASLVWHELLFGYYRLHAGKKQQVIGQYLNTIIKPTLPILPYTQEATQWHATERARLASIGLTPTFLDGQIAAIAYVNNLVVVTINTSDFMDFGGLQVENWAQAPTGS